MDFKTFIKNNHPDPNSLLYPNFDQLCKLAEDYHKYIQLMQTAVSSQRELLFAYEKMRTNHIIGGTDDWRYSNVDLFLSK